MHNIITSSILTIASLLIILLGAVDAQGLCCYSISSELKQEPNLYLLNFTASHVNSKRNNNDYIARIGFPKGYLIQGEPSSPFSYVRCIKKPELRERPVYECESKDRELFFVQFMVQLPQTSQTSQTPPQTAQTQTLPQTSQTQSSDTSQTTQLVPSDTTQSSPSDTLQPSPTDTLLSLQENIQSKNDTTTLTDTRVYIFGDKCEQRSFCIDLAASNDEQNSDKISLGPLGTWPKYAVITGGCILGLALVVALYLVYRRNVGYKYGEGGGGSYTRSGRNNSMFSPNSLLGSGGGHDGEVNYNYKPKNTLINIDDEDNNNNINRSSSMNYSNRSSGISNNDRSNRLSKHNKPHRESRIKQLESYIDEDEVVERRIDFNEKDAYDPFSSVDIELDKDTLSRLTKNDSYHHGNSNRSSKSRSNRSGNERSDEKDQSDFSDSDIQPKKRSSNDREDQRTERSRSKKQIHHSLSSKNNNDDHDSESHRGISTSIHSLRGKEYASSSDLTDKSNSDSNSLSMSGKPYGYHNMIFSWIDTIGDNYPPPIDAHLVISVMSMWTRMQPAYAANMWNEALNMRLGTEGLDLYGILEETEKRGISFDELMTIPENDEWVYSDGKSTTCVAFILQIYKAAGVFGPFADSIQVTEFTIRDAYMLKIFENNQTRLPKWCNNGDDKLPFCQILGKYRMELPLYNTLHPYSNMNENCPSLPPTYERPTHC